MDIGRIDHEAPRVIDGSGRSTLGSFIAFHGGESKRFAYSDSPLDADSFDDALTAHGLALDWISHRINTPASGD